MSMPYKGKHISMVLILPGKDESLAELEDSLSKVVDINTILAEDVSKVEVRVRLPRFKVETTLNLTALLKKLGMFPFSLCIL